MHELSIASSIVETVEENLPTADSRAVRIFLKIGKMSGVVKDALLFGFEVAAQDTRVQGATLEIEELPVIVNCGKCGRDSEPATPPILRCAVCGELTGNLIQGREMELVAIEIEDGKASNS